MVSGLKKNDRVQAHAKDVLKEEVARRLFGETWETQIIYGTVVERVAGARSVTVRWQRVGTPSQHATRLLDRPVAEGDADADTSDDENETIAEAAAAQPPPRARRRTGRRGRPRRAAVTVDVVEEMTDDDADYIPACTTVASAEEPEEDTSDDDEAEDDNTAVAHGVTWRPPVGGAGVTVDVPLVSHVHARMMWRDGLDNNRSPFDYFLHMYPSSHLEQTIEVTNSNLEKAGVQTMLTRQEYFVLLGLVYACSFYPKFSVDDLFSKSAPARKSEFISIPNLSKYMSLNRFKTLKKHLAFAPESSRSDDVAFWGIQPLIDAFNDVRSRAFSPGYKLVGDESMSVWKGKDQRHGDTGCPHVTKIIRKPKGVGMEIKNLACCDSTIMVALEIVAPKAEMATREYARTYGSGTSLLLRLSKKWAGSGRIVVADSAFASVKTAVALKEHNGLFFMGLVKTAHKKFPKKFLQEVPIALRGGHHVLTARVKDVDLRAVAWNDGKRDKRTGEIIRKCIVASCGTTIAATARPP